MYYLPNSFMSYINNVQNASVLAWCPQAAIRNILTFIIDFEEAMLLRCQATLQLVFVSQGRAYDLPYLLTFAKRTYILQGDFEMRSNYICEFQRKYLPFKKLSFFMKIVMRQSRISWQILSFITLQKLDSFLSRLSGYIQLNKALWFLWSRKISTFLLPIKFRIWSPHECWKMFTVIQVYLKHKAFKYE